MMDGDTEYTRAQKSTLVAGERAGIKPERRVRQGLVAAGSMLSALAASSCCIVPLVLFSLGASGAWISNFTALAPYQPIFLVLTLSFLAAGFWMVYRRPKATSAEGSSCARPVAAP